MKETDDYKLIEYTFDNIIKGLEHEEMTQRDRGTLFELLVVAYLKKEPMYSRLFDNVWMLGEVPEEYGIPKNDTGVDLVARKRESGELVAIQCKYYSKEYTIQKANIDSFLNEVGKSYYTEGIVITSTDKWSKNANLALQNRDKSISRIGLSQLRSSEIDWSMFSFESPQEIKLKPPKKPRPYQIPAIEAVINGFNSNDRGKLIMAPGTGKTFTSMVIAEEMSARKNGVFRVLYLVPSIQLLSQSLRGWTADSKYKEDMHTFAVCSDRKVTKKVTNENEFEDISAIDIGFPATTDYKKLLESQKKIELSNKNSKFLVVFSTYQSIEVISDAQKNGFYEFDLIICDEAHRTTGATEFGKEASDFVKVHNQNIIKGTKRLYQTATPRIYGEDALKKADEMSVVIADMNDEETYGPEFYRIGFGDAVKKGILTDYKVMVLAVDETAIARRFQSMLANNKDSELEFDDVTKIIGCWNGLIKRKSNSNIISSNHMKRAIAFAGTIRESKLIKEMFTEVVEMYVNDLDEQEDAVKVEIDHADGSMNALEKNAKIDWLKGDVPSNTCRILSNARFLTEGVDVPELDAVMFLKPRKSRIDIAQAVGRVMRRSPGKEYGYVILPIGIPSGVDENSVLDKNEKYQVVWDVLNALRSIDERFDATINKLELNKKKPNQLQIIGVGDAPGEGEGGFEIESPKDVREQLKLNLDDEDFSDLERAIYGKIVKKVGNVRYWEDWSQDVAKIAQQHIMRIKVMIEDTTSDAYIEFNKFLHEIRHNINDSISEQQAIEMLAQHLITKPVFEALFDSYSFANSNPVSRAMDEVLKFMDNQGLMKEQQSLQEFYESVRVRADKIDNLKAKQEIIIQLYDKFFRIGFKETTERLGIVFTPVQVVDFIIHSIEDILRKHFNTSISNEGVHILDPFTGTGTFIVRLLQSGIISKEDLLRKYSKELHANEIILLSYYIAAINIEETYHSIMNCDYKTFEGIVLTDTFKCGDTQESFEDELFGENNRRLKRQNKDNIFVIMGNPPYSVGAKNENQSSKNESYPLLDESISNSYAKFSNSKSIRGIYDTYIKAFRWSTDRIGTNGVVGFVTNGQFIDSQSADGLRKCFFDEFNYIYVFNLRGDARTSGEQRKKEAGNVFGEGTRTPISITLLVKDGSDKHNIYYHDIGDYLSRDAKLKTIEDYASINGLDWKEIIPDKNNDWINQRDVDYEIYPRILGDIFYSKQDGIQSNRDCWVYNFSSLEVKRNAERMIDNYNSELKRLLSKSNDEKINLINIDPNFISWSRALKNKLTSNKEIEKTENNSVVKSMYYPFVKKHLYYNRGIIEYPRKFDESLTDGNIMISVSGAGTKKGFSAFVTDIPPNYNMLDKGRHFELYTFKHKDSLVNDNSNINEIFEKKLGMSGFDAFAYVYGILHSNEYRLKYQNNLIKDLPNIPIVNNAKKISEIGKQLIELHLNYETIEPFTDISIDSKPNPSYTVKKMKHPKKGELDKIIFNSDITILNIPERAYDYVVNGKSAIAWIMDQYQLKCDTSSGIIDDPNLYSEDDKYIFNLLLRVINVSVKTVDLINELANL